MPGSYLLPSAVDLRLSVDDIILLHRLARKQRPFSVFRGDIRKPVKVRAGGVRRLRAMNISPAHSSSVRKFQRFHRVADLVCR